MRTKYWHEPALELKQQGMSGRKIAKALSLPKSTVNDFLKSVSVLGDKPKYLNKILILDIETSPMLSYVWGRWNQNVQTEKILQESFILSFAAKFVGEDQVYSYMLSPNEIASEDDSLLLENLMDVLDQASVVVAHNGRKFDMKHIKTRLLLHGFQPPLPYRIEDTLEIARREFKFSSNKLDDLCKFLGLEGKLQHSGFNLWRLVMQGDESAIETMRQYNIQDVLILEQVYLKLRAWDSRSVNKGVLNGAVSPSCAKCGSDAVYPVEDKYAFTNASKFHIFRCENCGGISRNRKNVNFTRNFLVNVV